MYKRFKMIKLYNIYVMYSEVEEPKDKIETKD